MTARPPGRHATKREAHLTRSDVFAFQNLPGLRDIEIGRGDQQFWESFDQGLSRRRRFVIEVEDGWRRFLPFSFTAELPHRGLFELPCLGSPPSLVDLPVAGVPLFSSPARLVPGGMAVVRAQIEELGTGRPAAGALLEIEASSASMPATRALGFADNKGRVVVMFPYPELAPPPSQHLSPLASGQSLSSREWSVNVRIFWGPVSEGEGLPDLCALLRDQPERNRWAQSRPSGAFRCRRSDMARNSSCGLRKRFPFYSSTRRSRRHKQIRRAAMPEYLAPGVYVEEISFRAKSIEGVSTTTTGFVGADALRPDRHRARHGHQPRRVRARLWRSEQTRLRQRRRPDRTTHLARGCAPSSRKAASGSTLRAPSPR